MKTSVKKGLFVALVFAQLGVLGWMVFNRSQLVENGQKIRLECEPVDPRSLFSGDYVILNYKISRFDQKELDTLIQGEKEFRRNAPVWVFLKKSAETDFHEASRISNEPLTPEAGEVMIKGKVANYYYSGGWMQIRYGLEQYFVPQDEGKEIETQIKDTSVEVAVNPGGDSAVTRIFISGEEVTFH